MNNKTYDIRHSQLTTDTSRPTMSVHRCSDMSMGPVMPSMLKTAMNQKPK